MRKLMGAGALAILLGGCGAGGGGLLGRDRPDEFAVARQAPLVIPPDYSLVPPQPGVAAAQTVNSQQQTLEALFGGPVQRTGSEAAALQSAGATTADPGVRSTVGDPQTNVVDKGAATRDIVAAPESQGREASAQAGAGTTPAPTQTPQ
jgi:hypothetical protein